MLGGRRFFYKHFDSLLKVLISRSGIRCCSVTNQVEESVHIPPRIERGPTDILKALSSTVGVDFTAFHFKYPDDPYFYALSENSKQILALSLESGRKSARWIFNNNLEFFNKQLSEPPIKEFCVKPTVTAESEPTEETLLIAIEERNVLKAIEIYEVLEKKNHDVSDFTKQCLLELTCFYNCEEWSKKDLEEKWFNGSTLEEKKISIWMRNGFAQKLFEKMDSSCSLANSTLIQGMLKYEEVTLAQEIFEAAKVKKVKLSVDVYNMFLSKLHEMSSKNEMAKNIQKTLNEMSKEKIKPNVGTLNALLQSLARSQYFKGKTELTLSIMAEFQRLGIEPSLGSYGYLFRLLSYSSKEQYSYFQLSEELMKSIENEKFEIIHPADLKFFTNASVAFSSFYGDPDLSLRLLDMYLRNNNSKFIVSNFDETEFLKNIFLIVFEKKPIKLAMDIYRRFFLTSFCPTVRTVTLLVSAIGKSSVPEFLVEVWEDMKNTHLRKSWIFLSEILNLMKCFSDESSLKVFYSAAVSYLDFIESKKHFCEDPNAFSKILIAFVKNGDEINISRLLKNFKKQSMMALSPRAVEILFDYGLSERKIPLVLESLNIAADMKLSKLGEMVEAALPFLETDSKAWVTTLINKTKSESKKIKSEF